MQVEHRDPKWTWTFRKYGTLERPQLVVDYRSGFQSVNMTTSFGALSTWTKSWVVCNAPSPVGRKPIGTDRFMYLEREDKGSQRLSIKLSRSTGRKACWGYTRGIHKLVLQRCLSVAGNLGRSAEKVCRGFCVQRHPGSRLGSLSACSAFYLLCSSPRLCRSRTRFPFSYGHHRSRRNFFTHVGMVSVSTNCVAESKASEALIY